MSDAVQSKVEKVEINGPICEIWEDSFDSKVIKIYYGIDKFMNTESDSDGKGLLIQQILNNQYGNELRSILNINDIQNWFLTEVNYEDLRYSTYQNIQSMIYNSIYSQKCCIIKLERKQQIKPIPSKQDSAPILQRNQNNMQYDYNNGNNPPSMQMNQKSKSIPDQVCVFCP